MNSAEPEDPEGDDLQCSLAATKLDVHRHERLAFTESPKSSASRPAFSQRFAALLKAMYCWIHSR
jgi:hypothetical protein